MQSPTQIIHGKWVITGEPLATPLENHALIVQDGLIKEVLPSEAATKKYPTASSENFTTHALAPGLINSHTHLAMNYFRGLADDLALMDWLNNHIWPAERQFVSEEFVYDASMFAMAEMIRSGTTCFNDMYFFLGATAKAATLAGLRAHIGITVIDFPTAWAKTADEYLEKGLAFLQEYKNHALVKATLAPHAPYTVSDTYLVKAHEMAVEHDLQMNLHLHETADEINSSLTQYKVRPIKRLHNLNLLSPRLIAIHMTQINNEDLDILAQTRPHIVHCPESNMKLASGSCPVMAFQEQGLNVALGTDGAASNNDLDMIGEMRTAALLAKHTTQNPTALSAASTLTMATLNGAKALGIDSFTGTLGANKAADFIAIKLDEIETLPPYPHPASQIVYAASRQQVTDVFVAGKALMKNRKLLTLDEEALKEKAKYWAHKIQSK